MKCKECDRQITSENPVEATMILDPDGDTLHDGCRGCCSDNELAAAKRCDSIGDMLYLLGKSFFGRPNEWMEFIAFDREHEVRGHAMKRWRASR